MAFRIQTKKIILAASALLFSTAVYSQEEGQPLKDLYPVGEKTLPDASLPDAHTDSLDDILDGLELTDEEKALLESPSSDDASKAANPENDLPSENEFEEESDQAAFEDENSQNETSTEESSQQEPSENEFQEEEEAEEGTEEGESESSEEKKSPAGISVVPAKKRPRPVDEEKAKAAEEKDETPDVPEKNRDKIKYGTPSEISDLIDELTSSDDPRFTEEIYDLFQVSQNVQIQQKILQYFTKLEDPCLEDFAVTVLNDPYDTKTDVVKACFEYIEKIKTKEAEPAVFTILESENETYFNDTLATIGEIGGSEAAVSLSEYLDRDDLSDAQRQTLMRTLGKLHAVETFDKIVEILENEDENTFVRMYAAEALGLMGKMEAIPVLINAFKDANPNLRQYAIKGLGEFAQNEEAQAAIIQGIRDEHWKVRQEAINVSKNILDKHAIPYLEYRAEHDSERIIKEAAIGALALYNDSNADNFLKEMLDKKVSDSVKIKVVATLLEAEHGEAEILALAEKSLVEIRMKNLAKGIGKELAKHSKSSYEAICLKYLENKDSDLQNLGLDMYKNYKFGGAVEEKIRSLAMDRQTNGSIRNRSKRLLGIEDDAKKEEEKKE